MDGRLRGVIVVAAVTQGVINMDVLAMGIALPTMAEDLDTTVTDLQWVVSGYLVALAAFFVAGGRAGDILGRRRLLLVGLALFGLSSLVAGAAPSAELVIAARIVQGLGAAIAFPVSIAIVTNAFPPERVARAIGIVFGFGVIGTAAGPFVGGLLTEVASWRLVLWINVPIVVAVMWLVLVTVDESRDETAPRRIDLPGLALIAGGVAAVSIGADMAGERGWGSPATLGPLLLGLLLLAAFVAVERRVANPLLDLGLFRIPTLPTVLCAGSASNIVYNTVIFSSTLYLQQVRDLSPLQAGLVFVALAAGATVAGQVSGRLERFPSWLVMATGMTIGGVAAIGVGSSESWGAYVPFFALAGLGLGLGWAYTSVATQAIVPPQKAGAAGGLVLTLLVGLGGIAVAAASSVIEARGGPDMGDVIGDLIIAAGVFALVAAAAVALVSRPRSPGRRPGRSRTPRGAA